VALKADQPPSRRALIGSGSLVMACAGLFLVIAEDLLDGGGLISHDETVLIWFVDHRTDWAVSLARWVSTIGGFAALCVLGVAMGLWLWRRIGSLLAVAPLLSLLVAGLASALLKAAFGRERPPVTLHATTVGLASFPSAHAADAAAFFVAASFTLTLTLLHRRWVKVLTIVIGAALAGLVGLSRLVLAVHWLSDVIAGWAMGTAVATTITTLGWLASSARHKHLLPNAAPDRGTGHVRTSHQHRKGLPRTPIIDRRPVG